MTINDFKIGALVEHNEWGDGEVIANNGNQKNINEALKAVDKFVNQLQQNIDNAKTSLIEIKNDYRNITAKYVCELLDELIKDKI